MGSVLPGRFYTVDIVNYMWYLNLLFLYCCEWNCSRPWNLAPTYIPNITVSTSPVDFMTNTELNIINILMALQSICN